MPVKRILCLALAGWLAASIAWAAESDEIEPAAEKLLSATVTVRISHRAAPNSAEQNQTAPTQPDRAESATAEVAVASGVSLGEGRIVTFAMRQAGSDPAQARYRVTLPGGEQAAAQPRVVDRYSGLVLLEIDRRDVPGLIPTSELPQPGGTVLTAAAAGIERAALSRGILSAAERTLAPYDLPPLVLCDLRATETSSGAAVVDRTGRLIGIVAATADSPDRGWTYAVPARHVERLLAAAAEGRQVELARRRPVAGLTLGPGDKEGVVRVERVEAGGPAARAGIRPGDTLIETDRRTIRSAYQAVNQILNKQPGDAVSLVVEQEGRRKSVEIVLEPAGESTGNRESIETAAGQGGIRLGPQLRVSNRRRQIEVHREPDPNEAGAAPGARPRRGPLDEVEMLRIQLNAFEQVIRKLQAELAARSETQAETARLIESLQAEVRQLRAAEAAELPR